MKPECLWPLNALLGEGPVWSAAEAALWFTDIKQRRLHRYEASTGKCETFDAPDQPGFALPARGGGVIVGMPTGLHYFHRDQVEFKHLLEVEPDRPRNRLNDASADTHGRLWFGSMDDDEVKPSGALYSWGGEGTPQRHDDDIVITNGPAFSPCGRRFYHTDTLQRSIFVFDVGDEGELLRKRLFITIAPEAGYPDGTTVDAEGCLWIALWGGWGVRRYSPNGAFIDFVPFPCANVTKVAFGGADLRTIYATTARKGLTPSELVEQKTAGGLFSFYSGITGQHSTPVAFGQAATLAI